MATTTNYGWTTPDDTALVKDGAAAIRTLGSSVDTTTKALNPSTTLGDIEYRSATANTNTRLAIGSTGNILTVSGGVPTWAAPAASGGMTLISETVASGLSSLSLSSIPGTYKQLMLVWSGIYHSNTSSQFNLRFNNNSNSIYARNIFYAEDGFLGFTSNYDNQADAGTVASFGNNLSTDTTNLRFAVKGRLLIDDYASTTKTKFYDIENAFRNNAGVNYMGQTRGVFDSTSAITSIDIFRAGAGTFSNVVNSSIRLYGIS